MCVCVCVCVCVCLVGTLGQLCGGVGGRLRPMWLSDMELVSRLMQMTRLSGQCADPGHRVRFIG